MRLVSILMLCIPALAHASYAARPEVQSFVDDLAKRHGFVKSELKRVFARVQRVDPVLEAIARPAERVKSWEEYRALLITERRVAEGVEFWKKYRQTLVRAERKYGVPPQYVAAIIGVETFYGRNTGNWRVVDALTTLAFDYPPRAGFFKSELESYLLMARDAGIDVFSVRGSYAGAIGSVANFLKVHGWQREADVLVDARVTGEAWRALVDGRFEPKHSMFELRQAGVEFDSPEPAGASGALIELASAERPSDYRIGLRNFYVITRYNRSAFYAAAVADLARELKKAYDLGR